MRSEARRIAVIGAGGRMGRMTGELIEEQPDLELVGRIGSQDDLQASLRSSEAEVGIDLTGHVSQDVFTAITETPDLIYCMTEGHRDRLRTLRPEWSARILLLDPNGVSIDDPYGLDDNTYRRVRDEISQALATRSQEWVG